MMDDQIGEKSVCGQLPPHPSVRVKKRCLRNLENHLEKIVVFYGVKLHEVATEDVSEASTSAWTTFQLISADPGKGLDIVEVAKRVQGIQGIVISLDEEGSNFIQK
ncbi:hypothetical protein DMENIID0001_048430 [Sergentomyia squamirostris]